MKPGIRVLGIDDSPFEKGRGDALVIGVVCRKDAKEGLITEGVLSTHVSVDGDDSTEKLCQLILASRFKPQIHAILLNSIMLGGFNAVDISELSRKTCLPILAITRKKPTKEAESAVKNTPNWGAKLARMKKAGPSRKAGSWHLQHAGIDLNGARDILRIFGNGPTRLAHIIASGIKRGESRGRA